MTSAGSGRGTTGVFAVLLAGLAAVCALSLGTGDYALDWGRVASAVLGRAAPDSPERLIVVGVRLPRLLAGLLVGGGLAASGAVLQGIFRNPMAEPGVLGLSGGGALGAVLSIHLGLASTHLLALPALAFAGALGTAFLVYLLATSGGRTPTATLLLAGLAVGAFVGALTTLLLSLASQFAAQEMLFWLLGGLEGRTWRHVLVAAPLILGGSALMLGYARELDILALGEDGALAVGVEVERVRRRLLVLASVVTAAAVAVAGIIAFVGLIVPHVLRLLLGPTHRRLLPACLAGGALFLGLSDLGTRSLGPTVELRLGVVTSLVGAPYFLYLLRRNRLRVQGID